MISRPNIYISRIITCGACLLFGLIFHSDATLRYVETNGVDTADRGTSISNAWQSITFAVQESANGDTIFVGPGYFTDRWVAVYKEVSIIGSDIYNEANPPLSRHTSRTFVWHTPLPSAPQSSLLATWTNNVTIKNITFDGNFITNVSTGIYNEWGNLTVEECTFRNLRDPVGAYGILCNVQTNLPTPDSHYNHFNRNLFENIIETNAAGIYLKRAPSDCVNNEFSTITGGTAQAGITIFNCFLTNGSPLRISIDSNYLFNCTQAIWANNSTDPGEEIYIRDNFITNCLVGIRVTSADAPAIISNNTIYVGGVAPTTNATPARGIWVHADSDPWNSAPTDHQIVDNYIFDISDNTGTVGVLLEYDTTTWTNINNGVVATVLNNTISDFDIGLYVEAGVFDIGNSNSPLVDVTATGNEIVGSETWAILAEGMTNAVIATNNWFDMYDDPSSVISGNVDYTDWVTEGSKYLDTDGDGTNDFTDVDDDGDGLLDTNEVIIGTSPIKPDSDYDNQSDWEEFKITGTDPTDASSVFKLINFTNNAALGTYTLVWPSEANREYDIYRTTNISVGFVDPPLINNIPGSGTTNTYTDITATNSYYYYYQLVVTNTLL